MTAHVSYNYGENEWYTPVEYINLAREVMGAIDLDPASSAKANEIVCATIYYDKQSDGLQQNWGGRLWLNPPYAKGLICKFIDKLVESNIVEAIVLVNNATETKWFRKLISITCAVVFPSTRIKFLDQDGNPGAPLQGQCFVYIGKNRYRFIDVFTRVGWGAIIS